MNESVYLVRCSYQYIVMAPQFRKVMGLDMAQVYFCVSEWVIV